jgi:hypothetical protein
MFRTARRSFASFAKVTKKESEVKDKRNVLISAILYPKPATPASTEKKTEVLLKQEEDEMAYINIIEI